MKNTLRHLLGRIPAIREAREARAGAASAAADLAESIRSYDETAELTESLRRYAGTAELNAAADPAEVLADPANVLVLEDIRDHLSDLLDAVLALHKTACESLDATQAMIKRNEQ